jgi:hypothetical protein
MNFSLILDIKLNKNYIAYSSSTAPAAFFFSRFLAAVLLLVLEVVASSRSLTIWDSFSFLTYILDYKAYDI